LDDRVNEVKDDLSGQLDIWRNNKKLLGEMFVQGIAGGKDFAASLKNINTLMPDLIAGAELVGKTLRDFASIAILGVPGLILQKIAEHQKELNDERIKTLELITAGIKGELDYGKTQGLISQLEKATTDKEIAGRQRIITILKEQILPLKDIHSAINKNKTATEAQIAQEMHLKATEKERIDLYNELSVKTKDRLALAEKEQTYLQLQLTGVSKIGIEQIKLTNEIQTMVDRYNSLTDASGKLVKPLDVMSIKALVLSGNFAGVLDAFSQMKIDEAELTKLADSYIAVSKEKLNLTEQLMNHELELMKIRGLSGVALVQTEIALKGALYGEAAVKNSLESKLALEKAITQEKQNQNSATSEEVALMKIAQKFGTGTANAVAGLMAGTRSVTGLNATQIQAAKQFAGGTYESAEAAQYFRTHAISRPEELRNQRVVQQINEIRDIDASIGQINVNVDLENVADQIIERVGKEIDNKFSAITKKVNGQIENF
jgi:DNA-binding transcriptional MerR regulator